MNDRREFLLKVATGVAYVTPLIYTLATPPGLGAQASEKSMGMGGGMGMLVLEAPESTGPTSGSTAPWARKP